MQHFFQTVMGQKFFQVDVKAGISVLSNLSTELKRANDLKECELQALNRLAFANERANELKERELEIKEKELVLK